MNFSAAFAEVMRSAKGMRLPHWNQDVVVRCWTPVFDTNKLTEEVYKAWRQKHTGDLPADAPDYARTAVRTILASDNVLDKLMTHPYLYVSSRYGMVPWKETVPELFSADWELVD